MILTNLPIRPRSRNSTVPGTVANKVSSLPTPTFFPGLYRVPRCRTMIDPPVTNSPENTLMPSRCEFESRPFLELPKPFLCAIPNPSSDLRPLCQDLLHFHPGVVLPVADGASVLFLPLEFEDQNFVAAAVRGNFAPHPSRLQSLAKHQLVGIV